MEDNSLVTLYQISGSTLGKVQQLLGQFHEVEKLVKKFSQSTSSPAEVDIPKPEIEVLTINIADADSTSEDMNRSLSSISVNSKVRKWMTNSQFDCISSLSIGDVDEDVVHRGPRRAPNHQGVDLRKETVQKHVAVIPGTSNRKDNSEQLIGQLVDGENLKRIRSLSRTKKISRQRNDND